MFEKVGL